MMLDLQSVRLFVLTIDLGNLSRAAEAAGTVQPAVSQRIRALERSLGRKLLDRTPRFARATEDGARFLVHARTLLAAHDAAASFAEAPAVRFALGASDHAVGAGLETVIRAIRAALPTRALLDVRVGFSQQMRALFDAGELDAVVLRRENAGPEGEVLGRDPLGWRGGDHAETCATNPVSLATLGPTCGVRAAAIRELERAAVPWRETFIGGGCAALLAAVRAGLGVAPMGAAASGGLPDVGGACSLPPLPSSEIILLARAGSPESSGAIRAIERAMRSLLRSA